MIKSIQKHKLEDVLKWSLDTRILGAEWVWPLMEHAYNELGNGGDRQVDTAMKVLTEWMENPVATKESRGYSVYRECLAVIATKENKDPDWAVLGKTADLRNRLPPYPTIRNGYPPKKYSEFMKQWHRW